MADADLQITVSADASGVAGGVAAASVSINQLKPEVDELKQKLTEFGKSMADALKSPNLDGVKQALSGVGNLLSGVGGAYGAMAGAALNAAAAVVGLGEKLGESAQQTQEVAEKFGVSATKAQAFEGVAALLGVSVDKVAQGVASGKISLDQYNQTLDKYGIVNQDAATKGGALAAAMNENKAASQGITNVLISALAPVMTSIVEGVNDLVAAFVQSYRQGGMVKDVLNAVSIAMKAVVSIGVALVAGVEQEVAHYVNLYHQLLAVADVLRGDMKDAQNEEQRGLKAIADAASDAAKQYQYLKSVWSGGGQGASHAEASAEGKGGAAGGDGASRGGARGGGGGQGPMQQWSEELKRRELSAEEDTRKFNQDMSQMEIDFWQGKLASARKGTDAYFDILKQLEPLYRAQQNKAAEEQKETDAKALADKLKSIDEETAAAVRGAQAQLAAQQASINAQIEAVKQKNQLGQLSTTQMYAAIDALQKQSTQDALDANWAEYNARMDGLNAQYNAEAGHLDKQKEISAQMIALIQDTSKKAAEITAAGLKQQVADQDQALKTIKQQWSQAISPIVSAFSNGLMKMAEGTESFSQLMRSLGQTILNGWISNIDKMVTNWAAGQLAQVQATKAGNAAKTTANAAGAGQGLAIGAEAAMKSIVNDAAAAAAGAYHAMSGIPMVGPLLGAAAAASVFAAAIAFKGMVSSAAGGYDIPPGVNPLVQAHAEEMILPASIARPLRGMIAANDAGANDGGSMSARRGGDVHHHYHYAIQALDGPSVQRVLEKNRSYHAAAMESLVRSRNGRGFGA